MPCRARASSMPRAIAVEVLLVAQPDQRGVIGRGGELDVDRPLRGAVAQVLVGDVAVVLGGADDARRQVIGAQEVQEVPVVEAAVLVEQPLGQRHPLRCGQPLHQLRRRRALEVDVQLGLGQGVDGHRSTSITIGIGRARGRPRARTRRAAPSAARSALASSRACTIASGRSPGPTPLAQRRDLGEADAVVDRVGLARPAAAEADDRHPDRAHVDRGHRPGLRRLHGADHGRRAQMAVGRSSRSAGPPSSADHRAEALRRGAAVKRALGGRAGIGATSANTPPSTSSSALSASVTSVRRSSRAAPVR